MSTPRSTALPPGTQRVTDAATGLATLQVAGHGLGTVLLAPGFTGSKEDFLDLMPLLAGAGWDVIAVDHRGQYESPRADAYSLDLWAQDLCRLAADRAGPVHLVGHSLGGLIAGTASGGFDWATVAFLNSGSGPVHQSKHDQLRLLISALDQFSPAQIWDVKVAGDRERGWVPPSAEVEDFMRERFLRTDPASLQEMARILLADRQQDLGDARGRLLVAFGIQDPDSWSWRTQVELAGRWGACLALIPNAAHSPAVEAPATTAALLAASFVQAGQRQSVGTIPDGCTEGVRLMMPLTGEGVETRAVLADQLWVWGMTDLVNDAQTLATDLLGAVRAPVELRLVAQSGGIRLGVLGDAAGDLPLEVERLAGNWGRDPVDSATELWAELPASNPSGGR